MTHEILTPTEKLKALRNIAQQLADGLGKVVTYDDEVTGELLAEAEGFAIEILNTIHDGDLKDIEDAVKAHFN